MDPVTATLVVLAFLGLGARAVAAPVTDVFHAAKGKTPPSLEKWRARHEARLARGEPDNPAPSYWRRIWDNAAEARAAKAAQKHEARMRVIRELGPDRVDAYAAKLRKRAARWDAVGAAMSRFGNASWERAKQVAADAARVVAEKRAEHAAADHDQEISAEQRQQQAAEVLNGVDGSLPEAGAPTAEQPQADVIPFPHGRAQREPMSEEEPRRGGEVECPPSPTGRHDKKFHRSDAEGCLDYGCIHCGAGFTSPRLLDADGNVIRDFLTESMQRNNTADPVTEDESDGNETSTESTEDTGGTEMSTNNTEVAVPEITDLATGIQWAQAVGPHLDRVAERLAEDAEILANNAKNLSEQMQVIENGQANLANQGFEGEVQTSLGSAAELVPQVSQDLSAIGEKMPALAEQLKTAANAIAQVKAALEGQRGISEQVQAHSANGVARETRFYQEA